MWNAFSVSGILRIPQTSQNNSSCVPEQDKPEFPNLLDQNATRNCSELLTAPRSNTHAVVSVAEKCNNGVNMWLWVTMLCIATRSVGRHMEQRCSRFAFCCHYVLSVSYSRGQCTGDLLLNSGSWTNRRKHHELRYKTRTGHVDSKHTVSCTRADWSLDTDISQEHSASIFRKDSCLLQLETRSRAVHRTTHLHLVPR
jgi:hypothetical protein